MDWQAIDIAPKDGILVRLKSSEYKPTELFFWKRGRWETIVFAVARKVRGYWDETCEQPTHWAPPRIGGSNA